MKKFLLSLLAIFILSGCSNLNIGNTPSKKVEDYLNKYQTLDKDVFDDLETTLNLDTTISNDDKSSYREFMKKHYQDMTYEIKNETIDGDNATVEVAVTVRDYSKIVAEAEAFQKANEGFENKNKDDEKASFSSYRLEKLKKATDMVTYTLYFNLNKEDDEWVLQQPSNSDLNKINGLYSDS